MLKQWTLELTFSAFDCNAQTMTSGVNFRGLCTCASSMFTHVNSHQVSLSLSAALVCACRRNAFLCQILFSPFLDLPCSQITLWFCSSLLRQTSHQVSLSLSAALACCASRRNAFLCQILLSPLLSNPSCLCLLPLLGSRRNTFLACRGAINRSQPGPNCSY